MTEEPNQFKVALDRVANKNIHEDDVYEFTQNMRMSLLDEIATNGALDNPKQQTVILTALKDMDKQRTDRTRLNIDRDNAETNKQVQEIVALIAEQNPRGLRADPTTVRPTAPPAIDDSVLDEIDVLSTETATGLVQTNYKEFISELKEEGVIK